MGIPMRASPRMPDWASPNGRGPRRDGHSQEETERDVTDVAWCPEGILGQNGALGGLRKSDRLVNNNVLILVC